MNPSPPDPLAGDAETRHQDRSAAADRVDVELHAANVVHWRELSRERNAKHARRGGRRRAAADAPVITDVADGTNATSGPSGAAGPGGAVGPGAAGSIGGSGGGDGAQRADAGGTPDDTARDSTSGSAGGPENPDGPDGPDGPGGPDGPDRTGRERRRYPWWIELPVLVVIAFLVTFLIQTFVARVYYVPSGSMENTLHGTAHGGDRILAYKLGYDFGSPSQGDVVVFKGPPSWTPEANIPGPSTWFGKLTQAAGSVVGIAPPNEKDFVKRVIAVGGQTVSCCDAQGRVQVDGVSLHEPYILMDPDRPRWKWVDGESSCAIDPTDRSRYESYRCFGPYKVPKNSVWVMGDHRSDSADSTYQCRGLVPAANVHCQGPIPVDDVIGRAVAIVMPPDRWGGIGSPDIMSDDPGK